MHTKNNKIHSTTKRGALTALLFIIASLTVARNSFKPPVVITSGKPTVTIIPQHAGASYTTTDSNGKIYRIDFSAPQTIPLSVLKDEKGNPIKDEKGNPFVLGEGGISNFKNYTTEDGLGLDYISTSCMDKYGNLWFGTGGGLSRYDGKLTAAGKPGFINYSTSEGLSNNMIMEIQEDKEGNLWIGTMGGLSKYDGKSFTNYTTAHGLPDDDVMSILIDTEGNMWLGTEEGISYCSKEHLASNTLHFINYTVEQGLINNYVSCIKEDRSGNIWFRTEAGLSRYNKKALNSKIEFINYTTEQGLPDNTVRCIVEDKDGGLWFATKNGLCYFNGVLFTNYTINDGLASSSVRSIWQDSKGSMWFGTSKGISRYNQKAEANGKRHFTSYTVEQGLANNVVRTILEDKTGNMWFGTDGGLSLYMGSSFLNYTNAHGLANNIWSIYIDDEGIIWFCSNKGLTRYNNKHHIENLGFTSYTASQGFPSYPAFCLLEDAKQNIWIGTLGGGIICYNGKYLPPGKASFSNYTAAQGLANNDVSCILEDKSKNLWFGTADGLSRYAENSLPANKASFTNYSTAQGLIDKEVLCMLEDKAGNIWVGTNKGVSCFETGENKFTNYTTANGLPDNQILNITEDKMGNLWFATNTGLCRFDGKSFISFTKTQGLPDDFIAQVAIAPLKKEQNKDKAVKDDCLVIGTNFGFAVLTGWKAKDKTFFPFGGELYKAPNNELKEYTPVFEIFNTLTGYPVKDINTGQRAMCIDNQGIVWAAAGSNKMGLVRFDYNAVNKNVNPPTVIIQGVKIHEENICWFNLEKERIRTGKIKTKTGEASIPKDSIAMLLAEFMAFGKNVPQAILDSQLTRFGDIRFDFIRKFYPVPENLVLPYQHNYITIDFAAIEPARPYLVNYQYILEGNDNNWSPVSGRASATFGNIHEGFYTFKVKAQSPDGIWSEHVSFSFTVLPPWYRTWWAYGIYVLSVSAILYGLFRWRTSSLRKDKERLEQTVKERTSELEKLSIVASETDNGVLICGPTGEIEWSNAALTRLLGYTFEEMKQRGKTLQELSSNRYIKQIIQKSIETKKSTTYQVLATAKNGNERWLQSTLTPILDETGTIKKLVVIDTDVTERKRTDDEIKQKNQKITDSINYALRIQQAILPSQQMIKNILPHSFIFFKPKDIVSGDFYWAHALDQNQILYAAVDCTGHGVPGAFMSIMGYNLLEQIVKEQKIYEPALILDQLSKMVVQTLKQTDAIGSNKEGMDIALCKINYQDYELEYAGAHNSLYLVRNGNFIETKANRRSIGISMVNSAAFTNHKIRLEKGDCLYIFSDGYADQKGGPEKSKFFYQPFRELLVSIHQQGMQEQEKKLEQVMNVWKGNIEQIDDILVIGVRV